MTESVFTQPQIIDSNGIQLAVYEAGSGPAVVLLHGFPELAYSWRHQFPALAAAGYRAIAPDLRGYGRSDKPAAVEDYRQEVIIEDIAGMLSAMGEEQALFIAHDWGALIAWQMALLRPELMRGLIALNIPFWPRREIDPIELSRERLGERFYIVNFQDSDEADRKFDSDPRRFISRMMRRNVISRERYAKLPPERQVVSLLETFDLDVARGDPLLREDELDFYTTAFAAGGFSGPINWYRNWSHNWRSTEGVEQRVTVPTLFIGADDDVIIAPQHIEAMRPHVDDLEVKMLADCGHWSQQEQPQRCNALITEWLLRRFPPDAAASTSEQLVQ